LTSPGCLRRLLVATHLKTTASTRVRQKPVTPTPKKKKKKKKKKDGHDDKGQKGRRSRTGGEPKKVFIAHGKNRTPLDQLKKALDQFKVKYAVAVDEPHRGRPISSKVAELMEKDCSSGIFIFTADERFMREGEDGSMIEVWRPSENVVYELGAASILHENRIVTFKEKTVSFPSDFSDLGYIEFEKDQLVAELGSLFSELVSLDILEVRAKG
jgi:predicted nucleotide-binding protein